MFLLKLVFGILASASEEKTLVLGESLSLKGSGRLWVGSTGLVTAEDRGDGVLLKGRKPGLVELRFGERRILLRVVKPTAARAHAALTKASEELVGLETGWSGVQAAVTGRLHSLKDYDTLVSTLSNDSEWEFRANIPERLREQFENMLRNKLGPAAPVRPLLYEDTPTALLNGTADEAARWKNLLSRWGISLRREESAVDIAPTVRVEIALAEVRKDRAKTLGLSWPASAEAKLLPDGTWTRPDLIFNARAFESQGLGRLLARPNLLCRSGKEAEFVAGGEFPIKIFNYKLQDVVWKRYGIVLKIKPKADLSGRISLALETEVSSIDPSRTVDGVPGLLTNKVASHFDLSRPRTVVLSGLLKSESAAHHDGLLGLSSLPILGSLFGSKDWRENRSELVVFVRPSIVKEDDP